MQIDSRNIFFLDLVTFSYAYIWKSYVPVSQAAAAAFTFCKYTIPGICPYAGRIDALAAASFPPKFVSIEASISQLAIDWNLLFTAKGPGSFWDVNFSVQTTESFPAEDEELASNVTEDAVAVAGREFGLEQLFVLELPPDGVSRGGVRRASRKSRFCSSGEKREGIKLDNVRKYSAIFSLYHFHTTTRFI